MKGHLAEPRASQYQSEKTEKYLHIPSEKSSSGEILRVIVKMDEKGAQGRFNQPCEVDRNIRQIIVE